jgi:hypothetical protein
VDDKIVRVLMNHFVSLPPRIFFLLYAIGFNL